MDKNIRIGVISADINTPMFNYGAILHTWAFVEYLKAVGYSNVENIDYSPEGVMHQNRLFPMLDILTHTHRRLSLMYSMHYFQYLKKYNKIRRFGKYKMNNSRERYNYLNISRKKLNYDLIIAEDDVIWARNFLTFSEAFDKTYFLAHDNMKNIRKISYAASMGDCNFVEEDFNTLREYLTPFEKISVRETYAAELIDTKLSCHADWVLDAVFLLDAKDYTPIISNRFSDVPPYIMLYLPADDDEQLRKDAFEYSEKHNIRIIEISNKIQTKGNIIGDCGVEDFLSSIYNAKVIFTNSFHALCFSLIFNKEFYVYSRKYAGKNKDLCKQIGLMDRYCPQKINATKLDYSNINAKIELFKNQSRKWLLEAIDGSDCV